MDLAQVRADSNGRIAVEDLALLQRLCDRIEAQTILEIGSADGGSSIVLAQKAKQRGGRLYCIEPMPRQRMVDNMTKYGVADWYDLFPVASPWLPWVLLSRMPETIDLLFIDGRHDLRWALVDYHYWSPRVRPGGAIIFHDTSGHCQEDRRQAGYGQPDYKPLVMRAIEIVLMTDTLTEIDRSEAVMGGAIAFQTPIMEGCHGA